MMTRSKRNIIYIVITWLLVGAVLIYGTIFTLVNGGRDLSFSKADNDVYEVDDDWFRNCGYGEGYYYLPFEVNLKHDNVNFIRLSISGLEGEDASMDMLVNSPGKEEEMLLTGVHVFNGINDVPIPRKDYSVVTLIIYDAGEVTIDSIQFRESTDDISLHDYIPRIAAAAAAYTALSLALGLLLRKGRKKDSEHKSSGN